MFSYKDFEGNCQTIRKYAFESVWNTSFYIVKKKGRDLRFRSQISW